ncbi:MAG: hypothetical protein V4643_04885 [Bacteroidota bacterium]
MFVCLFARAQKPILKAHYTYKSNSQNQAIPNLNLPSFYNDSAALIAGVNQILLQYARQSYLLANCTYTFVTNDSVEINIESNNSFRWLKINNTKGDNYLLSAAGFDLQQFNKTVFNPVAYAQKVEKALQWLSNNAFPFATFSLDSVEIDSNSVSANLLFNKGPQIVFDSIRVLGNAKIKPKFLANYTNIKVGAAYNENIIKRTDARLAELPYVSLNQSSVVYFYGNKAKLITYLTNKKSSSFDGIIGFAPNSSQSNKIIITGDINLKLQNIAGSGKSLDVNYRSFLGTAQELKIKFNYPYLFNTKVALDYGLNLLLYDTAFFDLQNDLAFQYRFIGTNYLKLFYSTQSTTLITIDTNYIKSNKALPSTNDVRKDLYGIGLKITKINYLPNPTKGYSFDVDFALGTKNIIRNPTINAIQLDNGSGFKYNIYDSINLQFLQYRITCKAENYVQLYKSIVLKTEANIAWLQTQNLFLNELFRIGGLKTLRGFDEQSIFANKYLIANTELRYILDKNSNVFVFYNQAWYQNEAVKPFRIDNPFGFGAGLVFESGAGVFTLVYAMGKQFDNPIEYNKAKIHFGYINYF